MLAAFVEQAMSERELNQQAAEQFRGPQAGPPYRRGDCVALIDGKIVAVEKNIAAALRALRTLEPDPSRGMVVEFGPTRVDVIR